MLPHDVRYALRVLSRTRGFTVAAILTLTLGIGMTTAIFSVVDAVLLRPVPFPDADLLVMIWETDRDSDTSHEPGSWPDFVDLQQQSRQIDRFAALIASGLADALTGTRPAAGIPAWAAGRGPAASP